MNKPSECKKIIVAPAIVGIFCRIIAASITPVFAPIGVSEDNWPATVGLFTGLFAKEAVVGTLDALYSEGETDVREDHGMPNLIVATGAALLSISDNTIDLANNLGDPLGIRVERSDSVEAAADAQGVASQTLTEMAALFGSQYAAFCYLVFVLLYAPCVAVLGAINKEAGMNWMLLTFGWTTGLAYIVASCLYQLGSIVRDPVFALSWIAGCLLFSVLAVRSLRRIGKRPIGDNLIAATQS